MGRIVRRDGLVGEPVGPETSGPQRQQWGSYVCLPLGTGSAPVLGAGTCPYYRCNGWAEKANIIVLLLFTLKYAKIKKR